MNKKLTEAIGKQSEKVSELLTRHLLDDLPSISRRLEWDLRDDYQSPESECIAVLGVHYQDLTGVKVTEVVATYECECEVEAETSDALARRRRIRTDTHSVSFIATVRLRITSEGVEVVEILEVDI